MGGDHGLRLLALDGGGVRGLSSLIILRELMRAVNHDQPPKPCEYFDMIGGTSTGGLIAVMLGRLQMTVDECIEAYSELSDRVFEKKRHRVHISGKLQGRFDAGALEAIIKQILEDRGLDRDELLKDDSGSCRVFVCVATKSTGETVCLTSYPPIGSGISDLFEETKIWQACRATSAATSYFDPISLGRHGEEYVDGALGANNPIDFLWEQAQSVWPGDQLKTRLYCIVSIGTGVPTPNAVRDDLPGMVATLKKLATETERTARRFITDKRYLSESQRYFRFNVERGLAQIGLEESKKKNEIVAVTRQYLGSQKIEANIKACVKSLEGDYLITCVQGHWVVPFGRNPYFTGRAEILERLLGVIPPSDTAEACQRVVVEGFGGIGKTQIVLEAAFRFRKMHPGCSVFWVPAVDAAAFESAYRQIGYKLGVGSLGSDTEDAKYLVKAALESTDVGSWLLIIDAADDTELLFGAARLSNFLPSTGRGSILFTTRNHHIAARLTQQRNIVSAPQLVEREAVEMLRACVDDDSLLSTPDNRTALVEYLCFVPLAIKQASVFMKRNRFTINQFHWKCQMNEPDRDLIAFVSRGYEEAEPYDSVQYPLATTWLSSIYRLQPLAVESLQFMCFFAEKDFPRHLFPWDADWNLYDAIGQLKDYGFVTQQGEGPLELHRLVRLAVRHWIEQKQELDARASTAVGRFVKFFPVPEHHNRLLWLRYLPHAEMALQTQGRGEQTGRAQLLIYTAKAYIILGRHIQASGLLEAARECWRHRSTIGDLYVSCMLSLATLHDSMGRFKLAAEKYWPEVERCKGGGKMWEGKVSETVFEQTDRKHGVAQHLAVQGKYHEAQEIHQQILGDCKRFFGENGRATLRSMHCLAALLFCQGKYGAAEEMHREVLERRTKALGGDDAETLESMNHLAEVLYRQDRRVQSERLLRQAWDLGERVLGNDHPQTILSQEHYALSLLDMGYNNQAEKMLWRVWEWRRDRMGKNHLETLRTTERLSYCIYQQGRYDEAAEGQEANVKRYGWVLEKNDWSDGRDGCDYYGKDHPDSLASLHNLARLRLAQGKHDEAERLLEHVLELQEAMLGREHYDTRATGYTLERCRREKKEGQEKKQPWKPAKEEPIWKHATPEKDAESEPAEEQSSGKESKTAEKQGSEREAAGAGPAQGGPTDERLSEVVTEVEEREDSWSVVPQDVDEARLERETTVVAAASVQRAGSVQPGVSNIRGWKRAWNRLTKRDGT